MKKKKKKSKTPQDKGFLEQQERGWGSWCLGRCHQKVKSEPKLEASEGFNKADVRNKGALTFKESRHVILRANIRMCFQASMAGAE